MLEIEISCLQALNLCNLGARTLSSSFPQRFDSFPTGILVSKRSEPECRAVATVTFISTVGACFDKGHSSHWGLVLWLFLVLTLSIRRSYVCFIANLTTTIPHLYFLSSAWYSESCSVHNAVCMLRAANIIFLSSGSSYVFYERAPYSCETVHSIKFRSYVGFQFLTFWCFLSYRFIGIESFMCKCFVSTFQSWRFAFFVAMLAAALCELVDLITVHGGCYSLRWIIVYLCNLFLFHYVVSCVTTQYSSVASIT